MTDAYLVLIGGGALSAILGLIGIAITKRETTPVLNQLNDDELRTYRNERLVRDGVAWCSLGRHEFRPGPGASTTNCPECLPPEPGGKWEPHHRPERAARALNFGKSYAPLYQTWPELFDRGEPQEASSAPAMTPAASPPRKP